MFSMALFSISPGMTRVSIRTSGAHMSEQNRPFKIHAAIITPSEPDRAIIRFAPAQPKKPMETSAEGEHRSPSTPPNICPTPYAANRAEATSPSSAAVYPSARLMAAMAAPKPKRPG